MLWPLESGAWTLPKNSSLELMSSVYSTLTPNSSSKALSDGRSLVSSSMSMYSVQFEMRSLSASWPVDAAAVVSAGALVATSAALLAPASLVAPPALDAALDSGAAGAAALVASSSPSMPPPPHAASRPGTASSDPPAAIRWRNCFRLVDRIWWFPL